MTEHTGVLVVGGGQIGLAAYHLRHQGVKGAHAAASNRPIEASTDGSMR